MVLKLISYLLCRMVFLFFLIRIGVVVWIVVVILVFCDQWKVGRFSVLGLIVFILFMVSVQCFVGFVIFVGCWMCVVNYGCLICIFLLFIVSRLNFILLVMCGNIRFLFLNLQNVINDLLFSNFVKNVWQVKLLMSLVGMIRFVQLVGLVSC